MKSDLLINAHSSVSCHPDDGWSKARLRSASPIPSALRSYPEDRVPAPRRSLPSESEKPDLLACVSCRDGMDRNERSSISSRSSPPRDPRKSHRDSGTHRERGEELFERSKSDLICRDSRIDRREEERSSRSRRGSETERERESRRSSNKSRSSS